MSRVRSLCLAFIAGLTACGHGAVEPPAVAPQSNSRVADATAAQQVRRLPTYSIRTLSALEGTLSDGRGINRALTVTGDATLSGDRYRYHAVLWLKEQRIDLGTLGGPNSFGVGVNDSGDVVIDADTATADPLNETFCSGIITGHRCLPVLWHGGRKIALQPLGGNSARAEGRVNELGYVPGSAETGYHDPTCRGTQVLQFLPVIWDPNGRVRKLPLLPGDPDAAAFGMNDLGEAVGASGPCETDAATAQHAVLWRGDQVISLGNLGGAANNVPRAINNRDQIVGFSAIRGDPGTVHAFLWENGAMRDLGTLPGDLNSFALGISEEGLVGGQSCDFNFSCRAILWQGGAMTDMNTLISPNSGLQLLYAIPGRGSEITGDAYDPRIGQIRAFVAVPSDAAGGQSSSVRNGTPVRNIVLPSWVREYLSRRPGSHRFR